MVVRMSAMARAAASVAMVAHTRSHLAVAHATVKPRSLLVAIRLAAVALINS